MTIKERPIRVAFTSIFYPLFMGRYLLGALLRRKDVEVWTAGPFTGRWIPWNGGMYLPESYVFTPNLPLPAGTPAGLSYPQVESADAMPWQPDLWLEVSSTLETFGRPQQGISAVRA